MLIEFSVGNFRSIKEIQTLSFVATAINEHEQTHTFEANSKIRLLKTIGIYGANASGKSNLVRAFVSMLKFIRDSFKDDTLGSNLIEPFRLDSYSIQEPSYFQIVFILDEKKYRYGFTYQNNEVVSEWLFCSANSNERMLFTRENLDIRTNQSSFKDSKKVDIKQLENELVSKNLILNLYSTFKGVVSKSIKKYFEGNFIISSGVSDERFMKTSLGYLKDVVLKDEVIQFINNADINIKDIKIEEIEVEDKEDKLINVLRELQENSRIDDDIKIVKLNISSQRQKNDSSEIIEFDFEKNESEGSKKMLALAGIIIDSIKKSKVLILDEFDARLHPVLTKAIIQLFNSNKNKTAQLCFVTHDTNLLDKDLLRRDQIYFSEKNLKGETSIYSLSEIKGVRNDASFEKDYIKGKYGAIPFIQNLNNILQ